jgi:DNA-binding transcriptional MerR regulator
MKTGEAAKLLGIDVGTVRNWIDHPAISPYFSQSAKGEHGGTQRLLTESDILTLNTIRSLRSENVSDWYEIAEYLESGKREQEFPTNAISADPRTIPLQQAEQSARAMATVAERDAALARVNELTVKVRDLEKELDDAKQERDTIKEQFLREIANLNRQIGRLEGLLEAAKEDKSDKNEVS